MSFDLICSKCGAPSGPSVGVCPFCKTVLAKSPGKLPSELGLIEKALVDGKLQDALSYAAAAAETPAMAASPEFLTLYARILIESEGPSSKIKSLLAKACLLDPANTEAAELLAVIDAKCQLTREINDSGELALRELLKRSPQNALAAFILGSHLFWVQGETEEPRRLLERAVQLRPNHLRSWGCLGEIYRKTGNKEAAARAFSKCIALETDPSMRAFFAERLKG